MADELSQALAEAGIQAWHHSTKIWPGQDWRAEIRRAIADGAMVFLALFSRAGLDQEQSRHHEELLLAISELRRRRPLVPWLIPVRLDDCEIPDLEIGAGRTLRWLQQADLFGPHRAEAFSRLVVSVARILDVEPVPHADGEGSDRVERPDDRSYRNVCESYLVWAANKWRYIELGDLGMEPRSRDAAERIQRLPLDEMYVSLQVDPRSLADRRRDEQLRRLDEADRITAAAHSMSLDEDLGWRSDDEGYPRDADGLSPEAAFERHRVLVILGHPGSGKSVMCQWLGSGLAWQELRKLRAGTSGQPRIPMKFRAADYAKYYAAHFADGSEPGSLAEFLANTLAREVGCPGWRLEGMFTRALEDGQAILLIDGLDELIDHRNEVIDALASLVDSHVTDETIYSQVVITSRIDGYADIYLSSGEAAHFLIRPMFRQQVTGFVRRFFAAIEAAGQAPLFLAHLEESSNVAARRLAGIPLSLTSMCSYWHRHNELPPNEAMLYRRLIVDSSFWWRGFAGQDQDSFLDRLLSNEESFLAVLARVAARIHEDHVDGQLTDKELLDTLDSALYGPARLTGNDVGSQSLKLTARIREKVGVLSEFSPGKFRFLHQIYREYLVGYDLLNRPTGSGRNDKPSDEAIFLRLKDRIGHPRWREPVLLALSECGAATRTTLMQIAISSPGLDPEEWTDIFLTAMLRRPPVEANAQELTKLIELASVTYNSVGGIPDVLGELDAKMAELRSYVGPETFDFLALSLFAQNDAAAAPLAALYWRRCWLTTAVLSAFAASARHDTASWDWPIQRALRRAGAPEPRRQVTIRPRLDIWQGSNDSVVGRMAQRLLAVGRRPWEEQRYKALQASVEAPSTDTFPMRRLFLDHPDWWQACQSSTDCMRVICALFGGLDHHDSLRWAAEDEDFGRLLRLQPGQRDVEIEERAAELVPRFGVIDVVVPIGQSLDEGSNQVSAIVPEPVIDLAWMTCPSVPSVRTSMTRWLHSGPGDPDLLRDELERLAGAESRPAERAEAELGLLVLDGRPMTVDVASIQALGRALEAVSDAMIRSHRAWFEAVWAPRAAVSDAERASMHRFLLQIIFLIAGRPIALSPDPADLRRDPPLHPVLLADRLARQFLACSWGESRPDDLGLSQLSPDGLLAVLGWLTTLPYQASPGGFGSSTAALWHEAMGSSAISLGGLMSAVWSLLTWAHRQDPQLEPQVSAAVQAALDSLEASRAPAGRSPDGLETVPFLGELQTPAEPLSRPSLSETPGRGPGGKPAVDLSLLRRIRDAAQQAPESRTSLACLLISLSRQAPEQEQPAWQTAALDLLADEPDQECFAETLRRLRGHLCDEPDVQERARQLCSKIISPMLRADAAWDLGQAAESLIGLVGAQASDAARVSLLTTARVLQELSRVKMQASKRANSGRDAPSRDLAGALGHDSAEPWFLRLDRDFLENMTALLESDSAADETLTQLLPMVSRIDDEVAPELHGLLDAAAPGTRWAVVARNLLTLKRAAEPAGYPGVFRDLAEMVLTADATTSARAYLQLAGPFADKGRPDRRYQLTRYGLDRWWELGAEVAAEADPRRRRLLSLALHEWDIDDAAAVRAAAGRALLDQQHRQVWITLIDTASIWRETPQQVLAEWLESQPPDERLATACMNVTAMLVSAGHGLPVTDELRVAAVRACARTGAVPRTVRGLAAGEWRIGVARTVADACIDAMRTEHATTPALDVAMANIWNSAAPVISIDSSGSESVDLLEYGNLMWVPLGARPEDTARFAPADLHGEAAIALLTAWAREFDRKDLNSISALDYATCEAVLCLLVVLSARDDVQFRLSCPPESMQRVFSRAVTRGSRLCAVASLTLLSRLRFVDLAPADGPDLIEVLDNALRAGPQEYAAAFDFLQNVRFVRGASLIRSISEIIEQSPNESVSQGFASLAAIYLSSPTCSTADARRLSEAFRADVGDKARRRAVHLAGIGSERSPLVATLGPDRQSAFRRLRRQTRSRPRTTESTIGDHEQLERAAPKITMPPSGTNQGRWLSRIAQERSGGFVYLIRTPFPDGSRAWYYVQVDLLKLPTFVQAVTSGPTDLTKYGVILYRGWGDEPPPNIKKTVEEEYQMG